MKSLLFAEEDQKEPQSAMISDPFKTLEVATNQDAFKTPGKDDLQIRPPRMSEP